LPTTKLQAMIVGTGRAVPEKVVTNRDLERLVDTSDEWIKERTGIERRHIADDRTHTSDLCTEAGRRAVEDSGISPQDIDAVIVGTVTGDVTFPATACYVQERIGAHNASAFDVSAACTGFIYGLSVADSLISAGKARNVLVIGGETLSRIVDWSDRGTCVLFGDGSGAVVVAPSDGRRGILDTFTRSDGRLTHLLHMPGGGSKYTAQVAIDERLNFLRMEGREVFKYAVNAMGDAAATVLERNHLTADDIQLLIPHQANLRIISALAKRVNVPMDRVYVNVQEYGNTSAASIPIAMDEAIRTGRLKPGDRAMLVAFGGGFTWGSAIIQF